MSAEPCPPRCPPLTPRSYVLGVFVLSGIVNQYHGLLTGGARKAAGVPYPNAYSTQAEADADPLKYKFNCAQRAHSNYLENLPTFLVTSAVAGLVYPQATAAMGVAWCLGRVMYARGYIASTVAEKGKGRSKGFWYLLPHAGLLGTAMYVAYTMISTAAGL